jgi:hypothetical protein
MKTKEEFHLLIDSIEDEKALLIYFELVKMLTGSEEGRFMQEMSPEQREDLLKSYEESFQEDQIVDHESVKAQFQKWL